MSLATPREQIVLVPWDPESPDHVQRLLEQRVQCGWNSHLVESQWRPKQISGHKCIYWITLSPHDARTKDLLQLHLDMYPNDKIPLADTATSLRAKPRSPTQALIYPVGHISLDDENVESRDLDLDLPSEGVFWIKTLYISNALQSKGIGRAAMDVVEEMAAKEPLNAKTLALDTLDKGDIRRRALRETGKQPKMTNQEWYERRGYHLIHTELEHYLVHFGDSPGMSTVFLRRDIASI
ncbi:hypothetical protein NM208_g4193 [Fusarium decemcellulare]|uniref:Uncharacterized protein n=1 Tax=Fusarium decemcellulare TaxID=57161 RepID=A0ACC1SLL4_9HYPO|nr:hypothetical protein NM208_g4193 [Fusarium decemcellulare]